MKRLATISEKSQIPGKKATITEWFFVIQGEESEYKAPSVVMKVLEVRNKLIKRDPVDPMKVVNETVFFEGIQKGVTIPDKIGGNPCGRTFPVWEGVKAFSAEQQKYNREQAGYYTYLFGEVTFPNKKPTQVNFRITPGQLREWSEAQKKSLPYKKPDEWGKVLFSIEVLGDKFAELEFGVADTNASTESDAEVRQQIFEFIEQHNEGILND
jgi:hypothetical protein